LNQQQLSSATQPVIELTDIHKSFGELEVLKGISLTARRGEVTALIGSSGSGKSTLLRCANLLEIPAHGEIDFLGERLRWKKSRSGREPADQAQVRKMRTNLSMVFQQFNLWAHMSVVQNVMEAPVSVLGKNRTDAQALAMSLLDKVGIADKADQYPAQLSGGEVIQVIRQLADEGSTMIIVTHDMKLAYELANQVIFLHDGTIVEQGTPEQVFKQTKSERLQTFLQSTASFG